MSDSAQVTTRQLLRRARASAMDVPRQSLRLVLAAVLSVHRRYPSLAPMVRPVLQRFPAFKRAYWYFASERNPDPLAVRPGEIRWMIDPDPALVTQWQALLAVQPSKPSDAGKR